jgi:superfamily II DNA or RNA helicase
MQELHGGVHDGRTVLARGNAWTILEVRRFDGCALVTLEARGPDTPGRRTTLITPFDVVTSAGQRLARRRRSRVIAAVLDAISRRRRSGGLWTAVDGQFVPLAWQLAPALAVLGGATRLLLADAVGLGKTVQAGLVLTELIARGLVERALVLTPAGLRQVWVEELRARFHVPAESLDQASLVSQGTWQDAGANPWLRVPVVVSSIDLVKRPEVRAAVDDQPIDLLIVDEAHHCTPDSDRGAVVARLGRAVPWLILVSATPHAGDSRAFRFLLDLGRVHSDEPAMRVFRRTRRDAGLARGRSTHVLAVAPTEAERRLQEAVHAYARDVCAGPMRETRGLQLVCGILARRATSSALAARRTLARRLAALSGAASPPVEHQPHLPWSEFEEDERLDPRWLGAPGLGNVADERARLRALIDLADEACAHPSKLVRLRRLLAWAGEPAIVFTEFRDTLEACLPWVEAVAPVRCLHGAIDVHDRLRALADFLEGRARVLLATDVAGEGLNLQARARLVVTIEWPWSPQRLEQRVGRVDRLGQGRRVHAVHLTSRGTFEDTVVARLLQRARTASDDLGRSGGQALGDDAVGVAVLGSPGRGEAALEVAASPTGVEDAASDEARQILEARRLAARAQDCSPRARGAPGTTLPAWCLPGRCGRVQSGGGGGEQVRVGLPRRRSTGSAGERRRVAVVFEVSDRSRVGRLDACSVVGIEVTLAHSPAHRREWKLMCRALAGDARVRDAALRAAPSATPLNGLPWQAVVDRLAVIRGALGAESPGGVQASLFDRRAVREASARVTVTARIRAHFDRKTRLLASPSGNRDARVLAVVPLA